MELGLLQLDKFTNHISRISSIVSLYEDNIVVLKYKVVNLPLRGLICTKWYITHTQGDIIIHNLDNKRFTQMEADNRDHTSYVTQH